MPPEIFASYSREDQAQVFPIVDKLRERGLNIWIDQEGIHGAKLWSQEIVNAIESSKVFILFASAKAFLSKNVTKELALASESDKHILPIFIEDAEIPAAMKYQLAGIQHLVHEQGQIDQTADNILRTLGNLDIQSTEPQPTTTTTPPAATKSASKTPLVATALVIALAVIGFLLFKGDSPKELSTSIPPTTAMTHKRIAVLPFRNIGTQENNFIAEGMHEEIDAMLSMAPNLMVKDASRFRNKSTDAKEIGQSLEVDAIITGSVRQANGQLRVIVKLVDTRTEVNLWAKTYDKNEGDIFSIQREIAQNVALGLSVKLDAEFETLVAMRQTENLEAYNLYLEGRKLWNTRSRENMRDSIEKFELALSKDSNFALAHVGIADAYNQLVRYGYSPSIVSHTKAEQELGKALQINNKLSEAHASLGWVQFIFKWAWGGSEESFKRAIEINPNNPEARRWYSRLLWILNREEEALDQINVGIRLDPRSPIMHWAKFNVLASLERKQDAMDSAKMTYELDPNYSKALLALVKANMLNEDYSTALKLAEEGIKKHSNDVTYLVAKSLILIKQNNKEEAKSILIQVIEKNKVMPVPKSSIALVYYNLGEYNLALIMLEEALLEKDSILVFNYIECDWSKISESPRLKAIWGKMGLRQTEK